MSYAKTTRHKNITRMDYPAKRMHGYKVRVVWKGQKYEKFFGDHACGDRLSALVDALDWRNRTELQIGKPRTEKNISGKVNSNTGMMGVSRVRKDGREVFEVAVVDADRNVHRTSYSIAKHGEKRALRKAVQLRRQHAASYRSATGK